MPAISSPERAVIGEFVVLSPESVWLPAPTLVNEMPAKEAKAFLVRNWLEKTGLAKLPAPTITPFVLSAPDELFCMTPTPASPPTWWPGLSTVHVAFSVISGLPLIVKLGALCRY